MQEDNIVNGSNLLATHSPLTFICNANYTGAPPDEVTVEIRDIDNNILETYRAIPYRDTTTTQRQFIFLASEAIRALLDSFEEFVQLEDTLEYVEGLTNNLKIRFVDPEDPDSYAESTLDFCHAARQFGQRPNMQDQYDNDEDIYYAPKDKPCYVYFYNNNGANDISLTPITTDPYVVFSESILYFGWAASGMESAEQTVDMQGYNVDGDIVLEAPTGFLLSLTSGSGFTDSLTIPYSGPNPSDTIYIKFAPDASQAYDITITPFINGVQRLNNLELIGTAKLVTYTLQSPGSHAWVCPAGVIDADVECYGGGGGGAYAAVNGSAGAAGGQYAIANLALTPGRTYMLTIANVAGPSTDGNDTSFYDTVLASNLVLAKGGQRGVAYGSGGTPGTGSTSGGIGDTVYAGGSGASGSSTYGGGGGGGAGSSGNGYNASFQNYGNGNGGLAGRGGQGGDSLYLPVAGLACGGGGGGAWNDYTAQPQTAGAVGASGGIVITYPDYS